MPDMDGFKLLEHVGLEMDLPVIMMSVDGETSRVMNGIQHVACDYLLKLIRVKELRNIWQHVLLKKMQEARDIGNHELDQYDEVWMLNGAEILSGKKRKDFENKHDEKEISDSRRVDSSSMKKARVVCTVDLHQKFVKAVNQIGFDVGHWDNSGGEVEGFCARTRVFIRGNHPVEDLVFLPSPFMEDMLLDSSNSAIVTLYVGSRGNLRILVSLHKVPRHVPMLWFFVMQKIGY
ncbi:two-component response regulator ARR11-like isoform X2 [Lycium barbarum]|uniref:two-component response regulator ARR11-like isoform X2 n=1 Tax=Lycium barbarum TaxID=112863 RepID=UPI00293F5DBF|nr:two-component response regulator ARR11-like isoform X2 [Lycium barbarum]